MKLYKRLLTYLKPYRGLMSVAVVSMALAAGLNALRIYLIKPLQDQVFMAQDFSMLQRLLWMLPAISILLGFFSYLQNYLMASVGQRAVADLRKAMFEHLQRLSMDYFSATASGKTMARFTNDLAALQHVIARAPIYIVRDGLTAIFNIGLIFYLNWKFALMTICILPISGGIIVLLGKTLRRYGRKGQEQMGELYSVIQENIQSASVVKAYCAESQETERFQKSNLKFLGLNLRFARADTLSSPLMEMVGALIFSFLLWKGGSDVVQGQWTAGSFLAFITYAVMTYRPLKNFAELNSQLQLGLASTERVFELIDQKPTVHDSPQARVLAPFSKEIHFDGVGFQYPARSTDPGDSASMALKDIHLRIRSGEVVALVGSSGAGKSTLALLLPRFHDPTSGQVRVDGQDLREVTLSSLRGQIGFVTQEVILFNESVRYNIAYGKPGATESEIRAAAEAANAHSFISRMPQGYDTLIGERGVRLSGGERQRLSIARALLKNPPILILDEATSSLDAESERLVQEAVERLMEHRTALVIAHRLATVRRADRIIVLSKGQIIEEGNHASLLERQGTYFKLHNLQILH